MTLPRHLLRPTAPLALVGVFALAPLACDDEPESCYSTEPGPNMRVGDNCLGCHFDGFGDENAPPFTAAGTVFNSPTGGDCDGVEGATITLTRADGTPLELVTNEVGNFYTTEELMPNFMPSVTMDGMTIQMQAETPDIAACNGCHSDPPTGGAPGKIFTP